MAITHLGSGHLLVEELDRLGHLLDDCPGHDHDIGLSRGGPRDDAEAVEVVMGHVRAHHLDCTAGEAEGQGPEGVLARQGEKLVRLSHEGVGYDLLKDVLGGVVAASGFVALPQC